MGASLGVEGLFSMSDQEWEHQAFAIVQSFHTS